MSNALSNKIGYQVDFFNNLTFICVSFKQAVNTLMRCRVMHRLIKVFTVCLFHLYLFCLNWLNESWSIELALMRHCAFPINHFDIHVLSFMILP